MDIRTKNFYQKYLGDNHNFDLPMSDNDVIKFIKNYYINVNTNNDELVDLLLKCDRTYCKRSSFIQFFKDIFKCKSNSYLSEEYWIKRGWSKEESKINIIKEQRKRSVLCIEYWMNKGYSENDAISQISKLQHQYALLSRKRYTLEYWMSKCYSENDAREKIILEKKKNATCIEYWMSKGYSENDAREKIHNMYSTMSLNSFKLRYPDSYQEEYTKWKSHLRNLMLGDNNPMYGKPSPNSSGAGYSGFYKNYYFRSLSEYAYIKQELLKGTYIIANDKSALTYKDKLIILYTYKNRIHTYIPDFIINGTTIVEIKNEYSLSTDKWKAKEKALKRFIEDSNVYTDYIVINSKDIHIDIYDMKNDFFNHDLVIDKGKLNKFIRRYKIESSI